MPEPSDEYAPTEADLDLVLEDATGKPVTPESLQSGIAALEQRIRQLEREKTALLGQLESRGDHLPGAIESQLTTLNQQLASARRRIAAYEALLRGRN